MPNHAAILLRWLLTSASFIRPTLLRDFLHVRCFRSFTERACRKIDRPANRSHYLRRGRARGFSQTIPATLPDRDFFLRLAEMVIFLVAVVGAVALGLAITTYFTAHTYIAAYLLAYAGFRCADLLVRDEYGPDPSRDAVVRRVADQGPLLLLFFAAPFDAPIYGVAKRRDGSAGSHWRWSSVGYGSRSGRASSWGSSRGRNATASISTCWCAAAFIASSAIRFMRECMSH